MEIETMAEPFPWIEAHRGNSEEAPENTLAAFRNAVKLGVPWIELDVHLTRDAVPVVIHDPTLDRTTSGSGPVKEWLFKDLRALDAGSWFAAEFAGERLPTLPEVVELTGPSSTRLNIEIKGGPRIRELTRKVAGILRDAGKAEEYLVSSFSLEALEVMRQESPETLLAVIGDGPKILSQARQAGIPWIHAHWPTATPDLVAAAHAAGLRVNIWTMDAPEQFGRWARIGVDKICTNRPARLMAAKRAYEASA